MKYKICDKVRVRKDLESGNYYGKAFYISSMDEFKGGKYVITKIWDQCYQINNFGYWWSEEMFESVNNEEVLEYALEKLGMTREELEDKMNEDKEDIRFIDDNFKEKNRYLQYCDKFNSQCEGCKIKKFKDKYKKHVVPNCRDIYKYLKEKGEI